MSPVSTAVAQADTPLVTKVYDVGDLIESDGLLGDTASQDSWNIDHRGSQKFGGGGMGGGGMGGGGIVEASNSPIDQLVDLVAEHTYSRVGWGEIDGKETVITAFQKSLVVTHNAEAHRLVAELLEALRTRDMDASTLLIEVRIAEVAGGNDSADISKLNATDLALNPSSLGVTLRCRGNRTVETMSGLRRSFIVNLTPVVGGNGIETADRGIGYRAETQTLLLGLLARVSAQIESPSKARLRLGLRLTNGPEEVEMSEFANGLSIDRVNILTTQLQTELTAPQGEWTVAGIVPLDGMQILDEDGSVAHTAFLVRWSFADKKTPQD